MCFRNDIANEQEEKGYISANIDPFEVIQYFLRKQERNAMALDLYDQHDSARPLERTIQNFKSRIKSVLKPAKNANNAVNNNGIN